MKPVHLLGAFILATAPLSASAGLYSDDLARCLVQKTSAKDKTDLVRWIFSNAALHPEVASISSLTKDQRVGIDRAAGGLLERLLTTDCRPQTEAALRYEGNVAMQLSFQVLGQVAMQELMSNPAVGQGFSAISQYVDDAKLKTLKSPAQ